MKSWILLGAACALACSLQAAEPVIPQDLPPTEQARLAIEQDPSVLRALSALEAAEFTRRKLGASPYDWNVDLSAQRRRYDAGGNSNEWTAQVGRTLRIGGKAGIDRELGDIALQLARARLGEVRHEVARTLASQWLDWLAALQERDLAREQLGLAEANANAVGTRLRAGDASVLELNAARADAAAARRQFDLASAQEQKTQTRLRLRFPPLTTEPRALPDPIDLDRDEQQWRERILAESNLLKVGEASVKTAELTAARARADRTPDPTVGVFTSSEARRSERIVGVNVTIPIGGAYRRESMQEAYKQIDVARAELEQQRREIELEVAETVTEARSAIERWRLAERAAQVARDSARLGQRAYSLGEGDLQSLLLLRRQLVDASSAALAARADALRARHRLLVDAHLIWGLEND